MGGDQPPKNSDFASFTGGVGIGQKEQGMGGALTLPTEQAEPVHKERVIGY